MVGNLVAQVVGQRDRLARSRAWQEHWLTDGIDEYELDAALWRCTQTAAAAAATMDAVNDAAGHPELGEQALARPVRHRGGHPGATSRSHLDDHSGRRRRQHRRNPSPPPTNTSAACTDATSPTSG
jgi:hypothetical protein